MKITVSQLRRIIKEEVGRMLKENYFSDSELSADFDNIEKAFGQLKDMIRKDPTLDGKRYESTAQFGEAGMSILSGESEYGPDYSGFSYSGEMETFLEGLGIESELFENYEITGEIVQTGSGSNYALVYSRLE